MPTKFNYSTEGRRVDLDPVVPVTGQDYDESEDKYAEAANTMASITESLAALKTDKSSQALDQYAVQAGNIVAQTSNYSSERERILQGLQTAQDRATVEKYYKELSRLRNGEGQGLSPLRAATLINTLTKNTINRHPGLALKIRQIHNGVLDDIPQVSGFSGKEVDPDLEAMQNLVKRSVETGTSIPQLIKIEQAELTAKQLTATLNAKKALGEASAPDVSAALQGQLSVFYGNLSVTMGKATSDPNFQGMNWFAQLQEAESTITRTVNAAISKAQLEGNLIISRDERQQILLEALAPLKSYQEIAKSLDNPKTRAQAALAMKQIAETADYMKIREWVGPMSTLMGNDLVTYLQDFSKNVGMIRKGLRGQLEAQVAAGDVYTRMILAQIDNKSFDQVLADVIGKASKDEGVPSTGNLILDRVNLQATLDYAVHGATPPEKAEPTLNSAMRHIEAFEALEKRPEVLRKVQLYPSAVKALKQNGIRQLASWADEARVGDLSAVRFNPGSGRGRGSEPGFSFTPVDPATYQRADGSTPSFSPWMPGGPTPRSSDGEEVLRKLNQQYRVLNNFVGVEGGFESKQQLDQWFADNLLQLQKSKDPNFLENTPKKEKESEPVEAPKTITVEGQTVNLDDPLFSGLDEDGVRWAVTPAK